MPKALRIPLHTTAGWIALVLTQLAGISSPAVASVVYCDGRATGLNDGSIALFENFHHEVLRRSG